MGLKQTKNSESSVVGRVAGILNLFSEARPRIRLEDAEQVLGLSQASAYRYLREMHEAGLLSRVSGGYMPGPKVIELEFLISRYDPLMVAAKESMRRLALDTGCGVLLGRLYDLRVVNVASVQSPEDDELNYPPGRAVPLFRGSEARVVLAAMDRRTRRRVFDMGEGLPDRDFIGRDWKSFNATLLKDKRAGYYISREELDPGVTGVAAPILGGDDIAMGSIVAVFRGKTPPHVSEKGLVQAVIAAAGQITARLQQEAVGAASDRGE